MTPSLQKAVDLLDDLIKDNGYNHYELRVIRNLIVEGDKEGKPKISVQG